MCLPPWFYQFLYIIFALGYIGGGGYLCLFGINFMSSTSGYFMPKEVPYGALALGGLTAILAMYGLLAPHGCCRGDKKSHLQLFYILGIPLMITLLVFCAICMLNANDKENLDNMLDYGWYRASKDTAKGNPAIQRAEADGKCCGFLSPSDRPVPPCTGGNTGCIKFLESTMKVQLGFGGILFAGLAGVILLMMGITHGWIERLDQEDLKAAGQEGGKSIMSGPDLDPSRTEYSNNKKRGMRMPARQAGLKSQTPTNTAGGLSTAEEKKVG